MPGLSKSHKIPDSRKALLHFLKKKIVCVLQKMQINARGIQAVENVNTKIFHKC